jgi:acylaminoacyl-peptidase
MIVVATTIAWLLFVTTRTMSFSSSSSRQPPPAAAVDDVVQRPLLRKSTSTDEDVNDALAYHHYASAAVDLVSIQSSGRRVARSVRDIDANRRRTYWYDENSLSSFPMEESADVIWRTVSPSGQKMVVFRKQQNEKNNSSSKDSSMLVEIYEQGGLVRKIKLNHGGGTKKKWQHGPLLVDETFGSPAPWDPTERYIVYTAEQLPPTTTSFFVNNNNANNNDDDEDHDDDKEKEQKEKKSGRGRQNVMGYGKQETFGEKLSHQYPHHGIYMLDVTRGTVTPVVVPSSGAAADAADDDDRTTSTISSVSSSPVVGQAIFQDEHRIVYTSWSGNDDDTPRRLGLIYCQQRPTQLHRVHVPHVLRQQEDNDDEIDATTVVPTVEVLSTGYRLAWSPRALPDGRLVFLTNKMGFETHMGCFALAVLEDIEANSKQPSIRIVVDTVYDPYTAAERCRDRVAGLPFPGLFVTSPLPASVAVAPNIVLLTTQWGSCTKVIRVDLVSGQIDLVQLSNEHELSSQTLLAADPGGCLISSQAPNRPPRLYRVPADRFTTANRGATITEEPDMALPPPWTFPPMAVSCLDVSSAAAQPASPEELFDFEVIETLVPTIGAGADDVTDQTRLQSILLMPKKKLHQQQGDGNDVDEDDKPPLIVIPHGGPHTASSTIYQPSCAFLCGHGRYSLLLVNYRGSTGFGTKFLEALPTRIGDLDVADVMAALASVQDRVDPTRIAVCGGSHGGFVGAHLTGQFPAMFQAAALRNPVINLPAMVSTTDIPDWCYVEGIGGRYHWDQYRPPSVDEMLQLYQKSPIKLVDRVQTPTLVALGLKDLRVPPSQGKEWYYALRSKRPQQQQQQQIVPTKLIVYDDDGHAIDAPASEADHWITIMQWFDEHLTMHRPSTTTTS